MTINLGEVYCLGSFDFVVLDVDGPKAQLADVTTGRRAWVKMERLLNEYDRAGGIRTRRAKKRLERTLNVKAAAKKEER